MKSIEHSLSLKDGRILAYHTFGDDQNGNEHPVLYFNGVPGCGLEAGIACAPAVTKAGGRVYAIDRPGMGKTSSPYIADAKNNADENLETLIQNIWELIEDQGWKDFSVIGVSGGGPYALALLASYIQRRDNDEKLARLTNMCLVGALCFSAGNNGMKDELAQLSVIVAKAQSSEWYRFLLWSMTISTGPIYNYLLPVMPLSWTKYLISIGNQKSPLADRKWVSKDENLLPFLDVTRSMMAQGGYPGSYDDVMIALRPDQPHEELLQKAYGTNDRKNLPSIGIFQGLSDANVPPSHAQYLHETIFRQQSTIFQYENLGHESTVMGMADEFAAFATTIRKI